ncbi:MAG TPA: hypothetical protein VJT33_00220 [bacterium]|nr:hypothetical protein [bacterium]
MDIALSLLEDKLPAEKRHQVLRELGTTLNREADVPSALSEAPAEPGTKGVPASEVLTLFLAHKGIDMALGVFATYVLRLPALRIVLRRKDGREFVLTAKNLEPEQLPATVGQLRAFVT